MHLAIHFYLGESPCLSSRNVVQVFPIFMKIIVFSDREHCDNCCILGIVFSSTGIGKDIDPPFHSLLSYAYCHNENGEVLSRTTPQPWKLKCCVSGISILHVLRDGDGGSC